ncbi:hypothetical protein MTR67_042802 [Solanum verrucosum]|uniref:Uncharacterized protein n=1 Tax=Solanum verrucosum TaxID=315347 RepID=A0AAF0UNA1_SOLVR|nr:hypothetical protein MTR67_042802 [Solanum verrucosum]
MFTFRLIVMKSSIGC